VKPLFWRNEFKMETQNTNFNVENSAEKIVIYEKQGDMTTYLLYGNRLRDASILIPNGVELKEYNCDPSGRDNEKKLRCKDTLRKFTLTSNQTASFKQITVQKSPGERPIMITLPTVEDASKKPILTYKSSVGLGTEEIIVQAESLDKFKLTEVRFRQQKLIFAVSSDKKSVTLSKLHSSGVTAFPNEVELEFEFEDNVKATLKLNIISNKVELVQTKLN
jgi:hypothetical protein